MERDIQTAHFIFEFDLDADFASRLPDQKFQEYKEKNRQALQVFVETHIQPVKCLMIVLIATTKII